MARKAIVNRETVLQLLREGKTSQSIASQFGVSRQAIDLYRKEFKSTGALEPRINTSNNVPAPMTPLPVTPAPEKQTGAAGVSLDQMIELMIQAFAALKKLPETEAEVNKLRQEIEKAATRINQLEEHDKTRREQEARWQAAQSILPNNH